MKINNIAEDIKVLEKYLFELTRKTPEEIIASDDILKFIEYREIEAIKHLLSDYKRVLKENEELRAKWDKDTHILQNELDLTNADKINNYIPIQKLKDKIEEKIQEAEKDLQEAIRLEKEAQANEDSILWWTAQIRLDERIKVLKELLKEKE